MSILIKVTYLRIKYYFKLDSDVHKKERNNFIIYTVKSLSLWKY